MCCWLVHQADPERAKISPLCLPALGLKVSTTPSPRLLSFHRAHRHAGFLSAAEDNNASLVMLHV